MYSSIPHPANALPLSFRHVDVLDSVERRVMVNMKQRNWQVGHEFKSFAFWCVHSLLASLTFVLAQRANCHEYGHCAV